RGPRVPHRPDPLRRPARRARARAQRRGARVPRPRGRGPAPGGARVKHRRGVVARPVEGGAMTETTAPDTATTSTGPAPGTVAWFQIGTDDPAGAREFYGGLFGWGATPDPDSEGYDLVARLRGRRAAGGRDRAHRGRRGEPRDVLRARRGRRGRVRPRRTPRRQGADAARHHAERAGVRPPPGPVGQPLRRLHPRLRPVSGARAARRRPRSPPSTPRAARCPPRGPPPPCGRRARRTRGRARRPRR